MKSSTHSRTLFYIITDSTTNSVFVSQVITPLLKRMQYGHFTSCTLVTFERKPQAVLQDIRELLRKHDINLIVFPIGPYMGRWSMLRATLRLAQTLAEVAPYVIIARGPLAGLLALRSYDAQSCNKIIIQARGLLAEEYAFTHQTTKRLLLRYLHTVRYNLFKRLEKHVYQAPRAAQTDIFFEVVSDALGLYIAQTFGTEPTRIASPPFDVTPIMPEEEHATWRAAKRTELGIRPDARVFTYCGSYKPWQCPDETINFFKGQYQNDSSHILLILTNDIELFSKRLRELAVDPRAYRLIAKPHDEVSHYLAAADVGILFREHHILNWVSRPTKALEYQAARLTIQHNNTVAYLHNKKGSHEKV